MTYLKSDDVKVFPFGSYRPSDATGQILNESNITRLVRKLTDYSSYVIDYNSTTKKIEFILDGYYFEATLDDTLLETLTDDYPNLYACIEVTNTGLSGGDFAELSTSITTSASGTITAETTYTVNLEPGKTVTISSKNQGTTISYDENSSLEITADETNNSIKFKNISNNSVTFDVKVQVASESTDVITFVYDDATFTGVFFVTDAPSPDSDIKSLHILEKSDGVVQVPSSSKRKLKPESLHIDRIVCRL